MHVRVILSFGQQLNDSFKRTDHSITPEQWLQRRDEYKEMHE